MAAITEALQKLDPEVDAHWTGTGLPRLDALASLGAEADRAAVTGAAPHFNREAHRAAVLASRDPDGAENDGEGNPAAPSAIRTDVVEEPVERSFTVPERVTPTNAQLRDAVRARIEHHVDGGIDPVVASREVLAEAEAVLEAAKGHLREAQAAADRAELERQASEPRRVLSHDIQDYHASQHKLRQAKAERLAQLKDEGFSAQRLRDLLPGPSKLDASFARKAGFGNTRPTVRPAMAGEGPSENKV